MKMKTVMLKCYQGKMDEISNVKKTLKECEKSKKTIEAEYFKCEKELNLKTEECEKLQIVIKDLKQLLELKADLEEEVVKDKQKVFSEKVAVDEEDKGEPTNNPWLLNSRKRKKSNSKTQLPSGKSHNEKEYNCINCDFQGTSSLLLKKHIELKHSPGLPKDENIKCRICGENFKVKWKLMIHRKEKHITSVAGCRNNLIGRCIFTDSMCWWNHGAKHSSSDVIECFVCNVTFANKPDMMVHRKKTHSDIIKQCAKFDSNSCRFQESECWFKHDNVREEEVEETIDEHNLVFQKVSVNQEPPLVNLRSSHREN